MKQSFFKVIAIGVCVGLAACGSPKQPSEPKEEPSQEDCKTSVPEASAPAGEAARVHKAEPSFGEETSWNKLQAVEPIEVVPAHQAGE